MKALTIILMTIASLAWGLTAISLFVPVEHLYGRGYGRFSAVAVLVLFPFAMSIATVLISLKFRSTNKVSYAIITVFIFITTFVVYIMTIGTGLIL